MRVAIEALIRHCADRPRAIAIVDAPADPCKAATSESLTWLELAQRVSSIRARILARTPPAGRVAISVPSGWRFWVSVLATSVAGRTPCLLPHPVPGQIRNRIARELGADTFVLDERFLSEVAATCGSIHHGPPAFPARGGHDGHLDESTGAILLSSGTTGRSRFVVRSSAAIDRIASTLVDEELCTPGDRIASFLPMAHAYGFEHAFLAPILAGARMHALGRFTLERAATAISAGASTLPLVPITAQAIAEAGDEHLPSCHGLRCVVTAGSPLPTSVRQRFERRFGLRVVDLYGASELGTIWLDRGDGGRPVRGVEIRLLGGNGGRGEIAVRSESMLTGFLDADGRCQPGTDAGFFATGDLGERDASGAYRVAGRLKLVFDVGGLKVNPIEVEQALETHPSVRRALVKPVAAGEALHRVAADVELQEGAREPTILEVRAHLEPLLAPHAIPRSLRVVDQLPRTESGKILREVQDAAAPIPPVLRRPKGLEQRVEREAYTQRLFDATARGYDSSSGAAFLRSGRWYRRRMLMKSGLKTGSSHLDVGSGTGLCAALGQEIVGPTGRAVALDPSTGMLEVARRRGVRETVEGRAESLPFTDASFDLVSMSYMLRHIDDLLLAFREARRVLRPGGRIVIFELTRPTSFGLRHAFDFSMYLVVPSVGVVASGRPSTFAMMQYWADTIVDAARPERIVEALDRSGFIGTRHLLELGVFSCYRGTAPPA